MNFIIAYISIIISFSWVSGTNIFYDGSIQYKYDCSSVKFDYPRHFDCACITGLWKFFGTSCKNVILVGGDTQYCFHIMENEITKAVQILQTRNEIAIQKVDGTFSSIVTADNDNNRIQLESNDILVTGSDWTLLDNKGKEHCLKTTPNSYCFFSASGLLDEISVVSPGCKNNFIHTIHHPKECVDNHKESKNICEHRQGQSRKIRALFGSPGHYLEIFNHTADASPNSTIIFDEDFYSSNTTTAAVDGNGTSTTGDVHINDLIASEIWNFVEEELGHILHLEEADDEPEESTETNMKKRKKRHISPSDNKKDGGHGHHENHRKTERHPYDQSLKPYRFPIYQFFELSKEVMKRTCPSEYVNPDFFNLAVTTFINIQKKHLRFPEDATSYEGYGRIVDSLKDCVKGATKFNFTINRCASHAKPVSGTYCAFGNCTIEVNMYGGFEKFEPIIETAFSIFKNAHSYCFNHFNKFYNDHHRFTMWMIPLFQNAINDIWRNGSATGAVYGNVFGNQENVQTAVAYCTASSQMLSKYPWDMPRPEKIDELSKPSSIRKKRQLFDEDHLHDISAQCVSPQEVHEC